MKKKKKTNILICLLALVLLGLAGGMFALSGCESSDNAEYSSETEEGTINPLTGEKVTEELPPRPILVSNDNAEGARPQSGISRADIVYEFPAEGNIPRLLPVYYSELPEEVAPVRSARPYLAEVTNEYDGIFVAYGVSPQADELLSQGDILFVDPLVSGAYADEESFWRGEDRLSPHDVYVNLEEISTLDKMDGWQDQAELRTFKWYANENVKSISNALDPLVIAERTDADNISLAYVSEDIQYIYDEETDLYTRIVNGDAAYDFEDNTELTMSNVIIQYVNISMYDEKRLYIELTQGGECLVFNKGKVIEGKWKKDGDYSPTIYYIEKEDESGKIIHEEIKMSVGKSWIQVLGEGSTVEYSDRE